MNIEFPNRMLHQLDYLKYEQLTTELSIENNWLKVAQYRNMYSKSKIEHISRTIIPAKALLQELSINNCTLGILGEIFRELNMTTALSVISCQEKVKIILEPRDSIYCVEGETIRLECLAKGNPIPSYVWMKDDTEVYSGNSFLIDSVSYENNGVYKCFVYNQISHEYTTECRIIVNKPERKICTDQTDGDGAGQVEQKIAILIGNEDYKHLGKLNVYKDIMTIHNILHKLDFITYNLSNLNREVFINKINRILSNLNSNAYVILYYAGHGFQLNGKYIMPIESAKYNIHEGIAEDFIIRQVLEKMPLLFVAMFDMCLKVPPSINDQENVYVQETLYKWHANGNLIRCYSTSDNASAFERDGESIYMKFLKRWLPENLPILQILKNVNEDLQNESSDAADFQIPMYINNTNKDFCLHDRVIKPIKYQ